MEAAEKLQTQPTEQKDTSNPTVLPTALLARLKKYTIKNKNLKF